MQNDADKTHIVPLLLIGIIICGAVASSLLFGHQKSEAIRSELRERSQTIASTLGYHEVMELDGEAADAEKSTYKLLKEKLMHAEEANHGVRSMYLMGEQGGKVFFYVDSEDPNSADYSPAGEVYEQATPELKQLFKQGKPLVEGPVSDDFGTFISGIAPIFGKDGKTVVAAVGMDISADDYWRNTVIAGALPLAIGLSLVLIVALFEWLRRRNQQLLALRSELVSVASHELRTPIIGIRWAAESLEKIVTDKEAAAYIHAIHNSASSLQASADDILELTHAINNNKVKITDTTITKIIREVFDAQTLTAQQKQVELIIDDSISPDLTIPCDADKMRRVLQNMISNAIKYTRDGTAVTVAYQEDEKTHRLLISDQGIGIPPTEQGKVLQGFYRASNAIASKVQGTGLGLYLVKTVLEQHGGKVSFISEEDKGTTFTLTLPKR